ncbi:MAG TPA: ketoacyl-ACP synthase III [Terriglobia bacterium]|nr:ketoacyl-ACP synthase III [Terriglobia bacterium]
MSARAAEIIAIDYACPQKVETNLDLQQAYPGWDMESVVKKTGVYQRHIAGPEECASDLAYEACVKLMDRVAVSPVSIDGLIVCTESPDYVLPPNAPLLQHRLGLPRSVAAFDYTLACSGYVYGLAICKAFIEAGLLENVLLVTCDTYSKYIRPDDRGARTLFGDAAAATLVRCGERGIGELDLATDGSGAKAFILRSGGCRNGVRHQHNHALAAEYIQMDGLAVLTFVKKEIPAFTRSLLRKAHLDLNDIDLFIFHQASKIAMDQLQAALGLPCHKTFSNLEKLGNTVSSSIPIAIHDAWRAGKLKPGMLTLLVGFGVGLSWGGALVRWTGNFR